MNKYPRCLAVLSVLQLAGQPIFHKGLLADNE